MALMACVCLNTWGAIDNQQYATINGINIANQWIYDPVYTPLQPMSLTPSAINVPVQPL